MNQSSPELQGRALRRAAGVVVLTGVLGAGVVLGAGLGSQPDAPAQIPGQALMASISPDGVLDLTTVTEAVAQRYRYVADHVETYEHVRCYCACEDAFAHRNLADCFLRGDGAWEAHGQGCGICMGEAADVEDHLEAGTPLQQIITDIDSRYGPTI